MAGNKNESDRTRKKSNPEIGSKNPEKPKETAKPSTTIVTYTTKKKRPEPEPKPKPEPEVVPSSSTEASQNEVVSDSEDSDGIEFVGERYDTGKERDDEEEEAEDGEEEEEEEEEVEEEEKEEEEEEEEKSDKQKKYEKNNDKNQKKNSSKEAKKQKKKKKQEEEDDEKSESALYQFPMARVSRIIKSEDADMRISQEAIFLINKASEKFLGLFSKEAYACAFLDKRSYVGYNNLSSVVAKRRRLDFLSDFVPEKVLAKDALAELSMNEK